MNKPTLALVLVLLLFAIKTMVMIVDNTYGGIQFTSARAHGISMLIWFWLPTIAIICCLANPNRDVRIYCSLVLALPALFFALVSVAYFFWNSPFFFENRNHAMESFQEITVDRAKVKAYRANTSALDSFDVILQQEFKLLPGIMWVHRVDKQSGADDVKMKVIHKNTIHYSFMGRGHDYPGDGFNYRVL